MQEITVYGQDGVRHTVHIYPGRIDTPTLQESAASLHGSHTALLLEGGIELNYVDADTFKNPVTGELFR